MPYTHKVLIWIQKTVNLPIEADLPEAFPLIFPNCYFDEYSLVKFDDGVIRAYSFFFI